MATTRVTIVKLGGSVITNKANPDTYRRAVTERIASELAPYTRNLILVHGTGSYGKPLAKIWGYPSGYIPPEQTLLWSRVHDHLSALHREVVSTLIGAGIAAWLGWRERREMNPGRPAVLQNICDRVCSYRFRAALAVPALVAGASPQAEAALQEAEELLGLVYRVKAEHAVLSALHSARSPNALDAYLSLQPSISTQMAFELADETARDLLQWSLRKAAQGEMTSLVDRLDQVNLFGPLEELAHSYCAQVIKAAQTPVLPAEVATTLVTWARWLTSLQTWPGAWT